MTLQKFKRILMYTSVTPERIRQIFLAKQINALAADVPFHLTVDSLVWPEFCPVLGIKLDYFRRGRGKQSDYSPSFDRVNPDEGYTPENTRIISNRANRIKNSGSAEDHRKVAQYIESNTSKI